MGHESALTINLADPNYSPGISTAPSYLTQCMSVYRRESVVGLQGMNRMPWRVKPQSDRSAAWLPDHRMCTDMMALFFGKDDKPRATSQRD